MNAKIADNMPDYIKVAKPSIPAIFSQREDIIINDQHPLEIETEGYHKIEIGKIRLEVSFNPAEDEERYLELMTRDPKIQWAIDNSFDGLYISKEKDPTSFNMIYHFYVYLKDEHALFWKLKYGV